MRSKSEIGSAVDRILTTLLQVSEDNVATCSRQTVTNWTSLMHIEIFFALEEEFGVRFEEDSMAFADSRSDLVDVVEDALRQ